MKTSPDYATLSKIDELLKLWLASQSSVKISELENHFFQHRLGKLTNDHTLADLLYLIGLVFNHLCQNHEGIDHD